MEKTLLDFHDELVATLPPLSGVVDSAKSGGSVIETQLVSVILSIIRDAEKLLEELPVPDTSAIAVSLRADLLPMTAMINVLDVAVSSITEQMEAFVTLVKSLADEIEVFGQEPEPEPEPGSEKIVTTRKITWEFDKAYPVGKFANGDWWVVGPVSLIKTTPASVAGSRVMNGSMFNPAPSRGDDQGYDSAMYSNYQEPGQWDPNLNIGTQLPITLAPGTSVVSTKSNPNTGARPQLEAAEILTVLDAAPPVGAFRPPYCGTDKTIKFKESDLDYSKLLRLDAASTNPPSLAGVADMFARPWIDHGRIWKSRYMHPSDNMEDYGRDLANETGVGALALLVDASNAEKRDLLVNYVQLGIDLHGILKNGGYWSAMEGHGQGRKFPILLAGLVLNDAEMLGIGSITGNTFSEDCQTFKGKTSTSTNPGDGQYGWEQRYCSQPGRAANGYDICCTANSFSGYLLAARLLGLKTAWNHDPLFEYVDRYIPWQRQETNQQFGWKICWSDWVLRMWDKFR
jgi:hypothetical protein